MKETKTTFAFMQKVLNQYRKTALLQKTADEMKISYAKARKILITLGEYQTDFSLEVGKMKKAGQSISEIASELKTSTNRVTAFLPYERNLYMAPEQTTDAKKSKMYRKRIKVARQKFVYITGNKGDKCDLTVGEKKIMKDNRQADALRGIHLHLELKNDHLNEKEKMILRKYGGSSTGDSIGRDVLIPSDMPLHNLHYAIQKLFGWQNSHLRRFILPEEIYNKLTGGMVKGWTDLVGILFQPPAESEHDVFWDDDYNGGSFKTWLLRKYTGPYSFCGVMEDYHRAQNDIKELIERFPSLEVRESFREYMKRSNGKSKEKPSIIKKAPLIDLTLEEMNDSIVIESGTENLLERLEVEMVLAFKGDKLGSDGNGIFPVTYELIYNYDFGDDWNVTITKEKDCGELLERGIITDKELLEAETAVVTKHKPVCIHKDGSFVLDDVGGLHGFVDFLMNIYEGDEEEQNNSLIWAQSLGWSKRKISNTLIL